MKLTWVGKELKIKKKNCTDFTFHGTGKNIFVFFFNSQLLFKLGIWALIKLVKGNLNIFFLERKKCLIDRFYYWTMFQKYVLPDSAPFIFAELIETGKVVHTLFCVPYWLWTKSLSLSLWCIFIFVTSNKDLGLNNFLKFFIAVIFRFDQNPSIDILVCLISFFAVVGGVIGSIVYQILFWYNRFIC